MDLSAQTKARLNHIAIYVDNLAKSAAFYRDIIGLDSIPEPFKVGRHAWFDVGGGAQLHVISGPDSTHQKLKHNHLCFSVPDLKIFTAKLTANKIPYEDWEGKQNAITTRPDGKKQIWFRDPDGYWIEMNDDYGLMGL